MNKFPKEFLFGASSAAYQVEGAHDTDNKGQSNWDVFSKIPGKTYKSTNGDIAVDHYNRFEEDIKLMKEQGLESYRFSIAWSRLFPENEYQVNQKGIDFYNKLIDCLLLHNIKPFITLYHWDLPQYLEDDGGWANKRTVKAFNHYANICFESFADRVNSFITFNEAIVFLTLGFIEGAHPPGLKDLPKYFQASHNVNLAHAKSVIDYKEKYNGEIGITHVFSTVYPADTTSDSFTAKLWVQEAIFDWYYNPILLGKYPEKRLKIAKENGLFITEEEQQLLIKSAPLNDFIGMNYYQPTRVTLNKTIDSKEITRANSTGGAGNISADGVTKSIMRSDCVYTKWNWEDYPRGLYDGLNQIYNRFGGIKIYITENGYGDIDKIEGNEILDRPRIDYIANHLKETNEAIKNGVNVCGYYAWSFTDLLSWLNGFEKQYGFVYIDQSNNLERRKKQSYYWYQKVIETQGSILYNDK